jgi:hypothetical protein
MMKSVDGTGSSSRKRHAKFKNNAPIGPKSLNHAVRTIGIATHPVKDATRVGYRCEPDQADVCGLLNRLC